MSEKLITAPNGAFGYTGLADQLDHIAAPFKSGESSTTIAAGDLVTLNTSGNLLQATTGVAVNKVVGVARDSIAAGATGMVVIWGRALVNCESGVAAGDAVGRSGSTAGRCNTATSGAGGILGTAITAASSNSCTVWIGGACN